MKSAVAAVLTLLLSLAACSNPSGDDVPGRKRIAITIDDAPVMHFHGHPSQWHRSLVIDSMLTALRRHGAPVTVFAIGDMLGSEEGAELMNQWLDAGADVGNHSFSHRSFNGLSIEEGTSEIDRVDSLLRPILERFGKRPRYFRFPYLEEGATAEAKETWGRHLAGRGYANARVTISTLDWQFEDDYAGAERQEDWAERYEVGQAYLSHVLQAISYWDSLAVDLTGRNVPHVLLLHANRVNRDYLGAILADLARRGFEFISLDEAYADPLYREPDEWISDTGTSFLENLKQTRLLNSGE
jgi:peptidoglycan/xylan/chitin deacetylase (PgdA/CDA1 family)